jgi:dynamin 1-like protein
MRLNHLYEEDAKPWAVFAEVPGQKFEDFSKVREKIEELTDKVAGKENNIVDNPIVVQVYSPTCPDLTVVDLPGLTRIPLSGSNQPGSEIHRRSQNNHFMSNPRKRRYDNIRCTTTGKRD